MSPTDTTNQVCASSQWVLRQFRMCRVRAANKHLKDVWLCSDKLNAKKNKAFQVLCAMSATYKRKVAGLGNFEPMIARAKLIEVSRVRRVGIQIRAPSEPLIAHVVHAERVCKHVFFYLGVV